VVTLPTCSHPHSRRPHCFRRTYNHLEYKNFLGYKSMYLWSLELNWRIIALPCLFRPRHEALLHVVLERCNVQSNASSGVQAYSQDRNATKIMGGYKIKSRVPGVAVIVAELFKPNYGHICCRKFSRNGRIRG
jgi:hypothetical protein